MLRVIDSVQDKQKGKKILCMGSDTDINCRSQELSKDIGASRTTICIAQVFSSSVTVSARSI